MGDPTDENLIWQWEETAGEVLKSLKETTITEDLGNTSSSSDKDELIASLSTSMDQCQISSPKKTTKINDSNSEVMDYFKTNLTTTEEEAVTHRPSRKPSAPCFTSKKQKRVSRSSMEKEALPSSYVPGSSDDSDASETKKLRNMPSLMKD